MNDIQSVASGVLPKHIAIIMDGNARWAQSRDRSVLAGYQAGAQSAVRIVQELSSLSGIQCLTLFALSSENLECRPKHEIDILLSIFSTALNDSVALFSAYNIRLRVIGALDSFPEQLKTGIAEAVQQTASNTGLLLVVALNYGGRWDIVQAAKGLLQDVIDGRQDMSAVDESLFEKYTCLHDVPSPDLLIRTSGEQRISNFMLWQFAYTELFFSTVYWPEFSVDHLYEALSAFQSRIRRFGKKETQSHTI